MYIPDCNNFYFAENKNYYEYGRTVKPILVKVGSGSVDIKQFTDKWPELTNDNFIVEITGFFDGNIYASSGYARIDGSNCSKSYNASNGILSFYGGSFTISYGSGSTSTIANVVRVWLIL